jgi:hypothetical protein
MVMERRAYFLLAASLLLNVLVLLYVINITNTISFLLPQAGTVKRDDKFAPSTVSLDEASFLRIQALVDNTQQRKVAPHQAEINNAPIMSVNAAACSNGKLFGKEHQGGLILEILG